MYITRGLEVVDAFLGQEVIEECTDLPPKGIDGSPRILPKQGLELGEDHLDRVHVGRVRRQVEILGADGLDGGTDLQGLVSWQVVHDHDVTLVQGRAEDLADIGEEGLSVHRAIQHQRGRQACEPETGDEGRGLPMTEGHTGEKPLSPRRPAVKPGHLGVQAGLVDEDQVM